MTNTNAETVRRYLNGQTPSVLFIANLAEHLAISCDWLLLGRGPMRREDIIDGALRQAGPQRLCWALGDRLAELLPPHERWK